MRRARQSTSGPYYTKAQLRLMRLLNENHIPYRSEAPVETPGKTYQVDILCWPFAIEVDGPYHKGIRLEKDEERDARLLRYAGLQTLRFTNRDVMRHADRVLAEIRIWLEAEGESRRA